jgi:hypothetical protein
MAGARASVEVMDTAPYRGRSAPLPPVLNVSPRSHERWRVAHDVAQRLAVLDYDYALSKLTRHTAEMRAMIRLRLDALHGRRADWL